MSHPGFVSLLLPAVLIAQNPAPPLHLQREADLARLWGRLKWVHPALAEGKVDWDQALVQALPVMAAAQTPEARLAALRAFLAPLADPAVRIGPAPAFRPVNAGRSLPLVQWLPGDTALLNLHRGLGPGDPGYAERVEEGIAAATKAKALILDLRPVEPVDAGATDFLEALLKRVLAQRLELPVGRFLYNRGWPSQTFTTSGGYFRSWVTLPVTEVVPDPGARPVPMAFILNPWTAIPPAVLALQKAGLAYVVAEGKANLGWVAPTETTDAGAGLEVTYRVGDLLHADGTTGFGADRAVAPDPSVGPGAAAVEAAQALLKAKTRPGGDVVWGSGTGTVHTARERTYKEMRFPDLPYRQLAVIRLWVVIDTFFPYKDLMDRPWADTLPEFLERMEKVRNAREYVLALAEMAARLQDNHVRVTGHPELVAFRGEASLPLGLASVEGRILVERLLDPGVPAKPWEEVLAIDGVPVAEAMRRMEPYIASANPWTRDRNLARLLGRGPDGSEAKVTLCGADGTVRTLTLKRSKAIRAFQTDAERDGDCIRILPGNIGYADLQKLEPSQVDALLEKVMNCPQLILDMRGYPKGVAWLLAPRLNVKRAERAAMFSPVVVSGMDADDAKSFTATFIQNLPKVEGKPVYPGKVIFLVSEVTQSQAEHTGLFLEAACGATVIGSPTAGSNGDVTDVVLPGGVTVSFTGQGVRHADGRQLQRVGLQPDILVHRTVAGLREGKDEVLERALRFIKTGN